MTVHTTTLEVKYTHSIIIGDNTDYCLLSKFQIDYLIIIYR